MTATRFFNDYGRHIRRLQTNLAMRTQNYWPYFDPTGYPDDIPIAREEIKKRFKSLGIVYPGYLTGVLYREGYITYMKLPSGYCSVISYEFSGCYMAKLCFRGQWYVFHISTSTSPSSDCKIVWMDFLSLHQAQISHIAMFKPTEGNDMLLDCARRRGNGEKVTLAGLIDTGNTTRTLIYNYENCTVADNADQNIVVCRRHLLCQTAHRAEYEGKEI